MPYPTILMDVLITLQTGLTDKMFAELIRLYPEAISLYVEEVKKGRK
jgi:hypothetical protein